MKYIMCLLCSMISVLALSGCATAPKSVEGKSDIRFEADTALARAQDNDPSLSPLFRDAAGYAVFPSISKGGAVTGGAYGKGVLYENGNAVGYCDISQASIGAQLGGQVYTEIIAFETMQDVNTFKEGNLRFDAQSSAVAVNAGAGANVAYTDGIAIFTMDEKGLMFEASIGGQWFSYQPM